MTDAERESIRNLVGAEPDDAELDRLWGVYGTVTGVAHAVLSRRLQSMRDDAPLRVTLEGDLTEDWTKNAAALEATIARLEQTGGDVDGATGATITTGQLVRRTRR